MYVRKKSEIKKVNASSKENENARACEEKKKGVARERKKKKRVKRWENWPFVIQYGCAITADGYIEWPAIENCWVSTEQNDCNSEWKLPGRVAEQNEQII